MSISPADKSKAPKAKRGFTLIELLVVISIIMIMTTILYPVIAQGREAARRTQCAGQLKQIGVAASLYMDDYDSVFPLPRLNAPRVCWPALLEPYLQSWMIFRCPNMRDAEFGGKTIWEPPLSTPGNLSQWPAYGWNVDYLAPASNDCSDFDKQYPGSGPPTSLAAVADPSGTVMCTGISLAPGNGSWAGRNTFYPERGGYFVASAPATVGGDEPCTYPYAGWGQGSYLGPYGGFESTRHGGRGNVLFVDGHIRALTPEQLAAGTNWTPNTPNNQIKVLAREKYLWDLQ